MKFKRFRRLRINSNLRDLVQEVWVRKEDLIYPIFTVNKDSFKKEVASMPEVFQLGLKETLEEVEEVLKLGLKAIILFGIPKIKDSIGSEALDENGVVAKAVKEIKKRFPEVLIATDLCFCEYTDHGHCGIVKNGTVENDLTLEILQKQAIILAEAGSDLIAPSGMMDGMVVAIREALDKNGFYNLPIMSYSTKFASSFYGPFRDAAESKPSFGDRKSYQMNPANRLEAIAESVEDKEEGADILMVKPALAYLDIVREIKEKTKMPLAVYNVSGEYAMLKFAAKAGAIDYKKVLMEVMVSFKRAGADIIISYHAKEVAKELDGNS